MRSSRRVLSSLRPRHLLVVVAALGALAAMIGGLARVEIETGVDEFVPRDDAVVRTTAEMAEQFGGDPVVVLMESAEPGELLRKENLPELLRLEGELAALPHVKAVYGPGTVLNQIAGQAQDLLAELGGYRDGLRARAEAEARADGRSAGEVTLAGDRAVAEFDERYGALLAQGMPGGLPTLHNQTFVNRVIFNDEGDPRPQWDFLVPRPDAVALLVRPDSSLPQSATEDLVAAVEATVSDSALTPRSSTVTGVPAVVAALGEQVRHEVPLLGGVAVLAVGAWFLLSSWTRRRLRLLPLAATLVGTGATLAMAGWAGRPLALTAVAFLPVLLGIGSDFMTYLHRGAGRRTVLAAALASAAGFAALAVAPVPAVADLGTSLAIGLVVTALVSLAVHRWGPGEPTDGPDEPVVPAARAETVGRGTRRAVLLLPVLAAAVGWALFPSLTLQSDFTTLADGLGEYDDARSVERIVGASGEVALVVRGDDVLDAQTLAWMTTTRREVVARHGDELNAVLSPTDVLSFLGAEPRPGQVDAALRLLPSYLASSVVSEDRRMAVMTYGVDLRDVERLQVLRDYLEEVAATAPEGVEVELAGLPMVAVSAQEAMDDERLVGAVLGILAAGLALLVLLRAPRVALVAMLSATLASGLVALGMAITGATLTPMTAGLGSLTAAVACEFTVLLALARRRGDRRLARSVDLAAAASATGYAVLMVSDLGLIRGFGLLLALTVAVALGVSRLLVWSLLPDSGTAAPTDSPTTRDEREAPVGAPSLKILEKVR
ncbi:MMPL family transporter [Nocardioides caeni]|uniref:RND transporter n=1 Tax=Nocardioides caeni TaxID=574700 RepID=A0A4S8N084_9ACTN|nr:MMPL family transporter [Nocardioides caeni]THV08851.1 RND transporter [Nocardioides caeni]